MDKNSYGVVMAIVIAGLLIAGAIMFGQNGRGLNLGLSGQNDLTGQNFSIRPADETDHLYAGAKAPVTIVEYSDLECPFCKRFHETVKQALVYYNGGEEVKVAWIFRHFPLESLHTKAKHEAVAAECAAESGGNDGFWDFIDKVFAVTPSNDGLDASLLPVLAQEIGLNRVAFEQCLTSNKHLSAVEASYEEAVSAGGTGTPFVTIIGPNGEQTTLPGAVPLADLQKAINQYLN